MAKAKIIPPRITELAKAMQDAAANGQQLYISGGRRYGLTVAQRLAFDTKETDVEQQIDKFPEENGTPNEEKRRNK